MHRVLHSTGLGHPLLRSFTLLAASALAGTLPLHPAAGAVYGTLGNFDVVNDTGTTAHGFEIDLEGISVSDVTDTFGGAGRYFPPTVERYGSPTVSATATGVRVIYQATFSGGGWNVGTPSGVFTTPGESCWTGGSIGYGPSTPCDHFGVGTSKIPTTTTYKWLTETAPNSSTLAPVTANLPAPVLSVAPPAPPPPGPPPPPPPPHVVAQVLAPPPAAGAGFGTAEWVKVFTTQYDSPVALEDLMGGNGIVPQETEIEWQLLQAGVFDENLNEGDAGPGMESVLYRYEFYKYTGAFVEGEAVDETPTLDALGNPIPGGNVGDFIGAQNNAINLNGVFDGPPLIAAPEPVSGILLGTGLLALIGLRRRR